MKIVIFCGCSAGVRERAALLRRCGVTAVLNMTDAVLPQSYSCRVENCSLSDSLSILSCRLARKHLCEERADLNADDRDRK